MRSEIHLKDPKLESLFLYKTNLFLRWTQNQQRNRKHKFPAPQKVQRENCQGNRGH